MNDKFTWKPVKTSSESSQRPSPRWGHSSCVVKDEVILFGGYANSVYMNDMWSFNTISMEWTEIKTSGQIPTHRSNCSLNYDHANNRLVLFGGGSQNKRRYNQINLLNWETKQWATLSFSENEATPWERTYHSAELLYPYLITFGGEGITDCDDLWIFNFESLKWEEVSFPQNAVRPCGRRFHTSCLIGNEFFVIGGCYSKYRPLSDVFSIDLTQLKQTGSVEGLQWKQRLNHQGFLTRWGQSVAVHGTSIYIFGGRFINDLNDLLVLDTEKNKISVLEVASDSLPKPRRRSCLNLIGNCLLMFGGFNSDYYNDLHYINIAQIRPKFKKINATSEIQDRKKYENSADFCIIANSGEVFNCHKGMFMQYFGSQSELQNFRCEIDKRESKQEISELVGEIYQGYGNGKLIKKYRISIPETCAEKQNLFMKSIQALKSGRQEQSTTCTSPPQKNNSLIKLPRLEYCEYICHKKQQNIYKDVTIVMQAEFSNERYMASLNKIVLMRNSRYFSNLLIGVGHEAVVEINIPFSTVMDKVEILLACLMTGHLVVPDDLTLAEWISLYALSDYFCLTEIQTMVYYQISSMITETSLDDIFQFASQYRLEDLAVACARFSQSKNCSTKIDENNKYYQISYRLNRFEINQEVMTKNIPFVCKNKNCSTEDMEQDKENNVESCLN